MAEGGVFGQVKKNKTVMLVVGILLILVIVAILLKVYKGAKTATAAAGDMASRPIIEDRTGITTPRQLICEQVAQECRAAVNYWFGWWGWTTSIYSVYGKEVANALNRLQSAQEAAYTSQFYRTLSGGATLKAVLETSGNLHEDEIRPEIKLNIT